MSEHSLQTVHNPVVIVTADCKEILENRYGHNVNTVSEIVSNIYEHSIQTSNRNRSVHSEHETAAECHKMLSNESIFNVYYTAVYFWSSNLIGHEAFHEF